jgi:protein gp37
MGKTSIEWASHSLNFYTWHCHKVSEGCKNCYMMAQARRYGKDPVGRPQWRENALKEYHALQPGAVVFVNSMSDTYHPDVPLAWPRRIHDLAVLKPDVIFLLLTKRPENARDWADELAWPDNLWIGTSVEKRKYLHRIDTLLQIPARGHFLSAEPLLESLIASDAILESYLTRRNKLGWVIVGADSGKDRRAFDTQWARSIRDACQDANVPFLYKQGSHFKSGQNRVLDGRTWDETPFTETPEPERETYQLRLL